MIELSRYVFKALRKDKESELTHREAWEGVVLSHIGLFDDAYA